MYSGFSLTESPLGYQLDMKITDGAIYGGNTTVKSILFFFLAREKCVVVGGLFVEEGLLQFLSPLIGFAE